MSVVWMGVARRLAPVALNALGRSEEKSVTWLRVSMKTVVN